MTENTKPQLHPSMLDTLSRCGIQFQRRYGARFGIWHEEEIHPPAVVMAIGTATHKSVERNLQHRIDTGEPISAEEAANIARDEFYRVKEKEGLMLHAAEALDVEGTVGKAVDMSKDLALLHHSDRAPLLDPVAVEKRFVIEMTDLPFDLSGQMDIIVTDGIEDTKTRARSKGEYAAQTPQMAMYATAYKTDPDLGNGAFPATVTVAELLKYQAGPQIKIFQAVPSDLWMQPLYHRIERFAEILEAVKAGKQAFTPAQPDDWQCTARWCGYARTCPFWSGREQ